MSVCLLCIRIHRVCLSDLNPSKNLYYLRSKCFWIVIIKHKTRNFHFASLKMFHSVDDLLLLRFFFLKIHSVKKLFIYEYIYYVTSMMQIHTRDVSPLSRLPLNICQNIRIIARSAPRISNVYKLLRVRLLHACKILCVCRAVLNVYLRRISESNTYYRGFQFH